MQQSRVILYHNNPASARLRFLRFSYHRVCYPEALPALSVLSDTLSDASHSIAIHPAATIQQVEKQLHLESGELQVEGEYRASVDVAGGPVSVFLARFNSIDPPFELAQMIGARFIDLNEARDLPQVELELLRKAYELILGG